MNFNPIAASKAIQESYHEYAKTTFFIRDDEFRSQFNAILEQYGFSKGPYIDATSSFKSGKSLHDMVSDGVLNSKFSKLLNKDREQYDRPLFLHQEKAIVEALQDENMIITTGTGSGKTECFLYPLLNHLFEQEETGSLDKGVFALLLYPMNALANDQLKRLRKLLKEYPNITFGAYTGETEDEERKALSKYRRLYNEDPIPNELISRERMKITPPNILITNYAMLEYLLLRPADNVFFHGEYADHWKYIVLDEAHTYRGATGMEVSLLLRRLIHTLPNSQQIRFMMTSATLGDSETSDEILLFAERLCCNRSFRKDSIIRAERNPLLEPAESYLIQQCEISSLAQLLEDNEKNDIQKIEEANRLLTRELITDHPIKKFNEWVYQVLEHDPLTCIFRQLLLDGTLTLESLCKELSVDPAYLKDFIILANFAVKNSTKLIDTRYHHFIRTLEGAYVTFKPEKTLTATPRTEAEFESGTFKCFKISVCQYCGQIYLVGFRDKLTGKFDQSRRTSNTYFMIIDDEFLKTRTDEDGDEGRYLKHMYTLCGKCGAMHRTHSSNLEGVCSCGQEHSIKVLEIKLDDGQADLHTCEYCKTTNPRGSVIRGFYIGQNAAAAVIGSTLYEQMPIKAHETTRMQKGIGKAREVTEYKDTKQLLIFSDSRQDAAYFAPYFQFTYQNILRRRVLYQSAIDLCATYSDKPIPFFSLLKSVASNLELTDQVDPEGAMKEAWKVLLYEMRSRDRNGLVNLGMLTFSVDSQYNEGYQKLTTEELRTIDVFLMSSIILEGAIKRPNGISLTEDDISYYMFHGREAVFMPGKQNKDIKKSGKVIRYWLAKNSNRRTEYLQRTGVFPDKPEIEDFLSKYWDGMCESDLVCESGFYTLDPKKICVRVNGYHEDMHWYQCDVCGRITTLNCRDVCPHFRCKGMLHPVDPSTLKEYFQKHLSGEALFPMKVREHTAQLSHDRAADYQEAFINGDIHVLSSSTTFEMGVDVGELETIFMRNMPPNPSNYIQRAGRAGRRNDSAAYALTFCRLSNHDLTFFKNPQHMINGIISPPMFKIDNAKIVRRHVSAALFAAFWRDHSDLKTVKNLFEDAVFQEYLEFLKDVPVPVMSYINEFVPDSISSKNIEEMIADLCNEDGRLQNAKAAHEEEISQIETIRQQLKSEGVYGWKHDSLNKAQQTIEDTKIIDHLSRNNLIPKYGFPVDTVELRTDLLSLKSFKSQSNLKLQRDLFQAITDYAPGAEVIADGKMYTSRYIKRPYLRDHDWSQYDFGICENSECGTITIRKHYGVEDQSSLIHEKCPNCGSHFTSQSTQTFIVPSYGFIVSTEAPKEVTTKKPRQMGRTHINYIGGNNASNRLSVRKYKFRGVRVTVTTSKDDELAIINRSNFYICKTCGYAEEAPRDGAKVSKRKEHYNARGKRCSNDYLFKSTLGHTFKTDVTKLTVNSYFDEGPAYSLLYTFLEGLSKFFEIERNDIDGCLYRTKAESGAWTTTFILFDKVPGGAGNANRLGNLGEKQFRNYLNSCFSIVNDCDCGDNKDGNAACYSCLCNYRNQYYHEILKRKYAVDFISGMLGNKISKHISEIVPVDEVGMGIRELTDHVYDQVIDALSDKEEPEVFYELTNNTGECVGQAEIAWPVSKIAIVDPLEKSLWEKHGWRVFLTTDSVESILTRVNDI